MTIPVLFLIVYTVLLFPQVAHLRRHNKGFETENDNALDRSERTPHPRVKTSKPLLRTPKPFDGPYDYGTSLDDSNDVIDDVSNINDPNDFTLTEDEKDKKTESSKKWQSKNAEAHNNRANTKSKTNAEKCWQSRSRKAIGRLNKLDKKYENARNEFVNSVDCNQFDREMLVMMVTNRSVSERASHKAGGVPSAVPAGLNLGGHVMMRLGNSMVFFYRLKVRDDTLFTVTFLQSNLSTMSLLARVDLHDLRLQGEYERATLDNDPANLIYRPTFGTAEILLKDAMYKLSGRYRMRGNELMLEMVVSDVTAKEVQISYIDVHGNITGTNPINIKSLDSFLTRMKADLDEWARDYFNDYLTYFALSSPKASEDYKKYDAQKTHVLNEFADSTIRRLRKKQNRLKIASVKIPSFNILAVNGMELRLEDGVIHGLDSFHRRSQTTMQQIDAQLRNLDVELRFTNLKVTYRYTAASGTSVPPVGGILVLNINDVRARMNLGLVNDEMSATVAFLRQAKPEALTVEGPGNKLIGTFKHLLEHHVIAIMSTNLELNIGKLGSLMKCAPDFDGYKDLGDFDNPVSDDTSSSDNSNDDSSSSDETTENPCATYTGPTHQPTLAKGKILNSSDQTDESNTDNNKTENKLQRQSKESDDITTEDDEKLDDTDA